MYCYKCGTKNADNATYCYKCNTKISSIPLPSKPQTPTELDSKALAIYLHDVLTLEYARRREAITINTLDYNYKRSLTYAYKKETISSYNYFHLKYDGKNYYIAVNRDKSVCLDSTLSGSDWYWLEIESNMQRLYKQDTWRNGSTYANFITKIPKRIQWRDKFFQTYEEFKLTAPGEFQKIKDNYNIYVNKRNDMYAEFSHIKEMLLKTYDLNIIPDQYRNIYAIYYLYNFISTSNQSLSIALLHFDLKEIKSKLDKIIEQQEELILNQSILMSQNEELMEQNQSYLSTLSKIESNTAQTSQYASIAARNSELCAWIGYANYLK